MISILFLLNLATAHADSKPAYVWSRYPAAVGKVLPAEKYHAVDARDEEKDWREQGYLPPNRRDALFNKLKIAEAVRPLDEMSKDMLVMRAKFEELSRFRKYYPMLKETQLKALIAEVRAMK